MDVGCGVRMIVGRPVGEPTISDGTAVRATEGTPHGKAEEGMKLGITALGSADEKTLGVAVRVVTGTLVGTSLTTAVGLRVGAVGD